MYRTESIKTEANAGISIYGARENNLKNINAYIPHNKFVVITGISGSGKSSLAYDTIFAEAQRRYLETFSAYARRFIGKFERADVDEISGLSPAISIEQKTISKNPRSTVGTITEIYDFFRLLYARVSDAYSYVTQKPMLCHTEAQILEKIKLKFSGKKIHIFSSLIRGRKGHYNELFQLWHKRGFLYVRADGELIELNPRLRLDRYKTHDIDLHIDTIYVDDKDAQRLRNSVSMSLKYGNEQCLVQEEDDTQISFFSKNLMCEDTGIAYNLPEPNLFSFNSPYGACPKCNGLGTITKVSTDKIFPDKYLSIRNGGIAPLGKYKHSYIFRQIETLGKKYGFNIDEPIGELSEDVINMLLYGSHDYFHFTCDYMDVANEIPVRYEGISAYLEQQNTEEAPVKLQRWASSFLDKTICPDCNGTRLKKESLFFFIDGKNISDISNLQIAKLQDWIQELPKKLNSKQQFIANDIIKEIQNRLKFLTDVGLEYITLSRPTQTLSSGEMQRIRLATQLGSNLTGVLYILDEPSIGLHQRDNIRLIESLKQLRDKGNSIIVIEHDKEMIEAADYIIDIGPGAGINGGKIVLLGYKNQISHSDSITCRYIRGDLSIPVPVKRRKNNGKSLKIFNCTGNNLKNITLNLPLGLFTCITGVSGSGKSTLLNKTLYPAVSNILYKSEKNTLPYSSIEGVENINKIIEVNQQPFGKTTRSNPATYTGVFDYIRKLYTETTQSKMRGYKAGRFSFNVKGGRCETCKGTGFENIETGLLPSVKVLCRHCQGKRFNRETLEIRYKGKSVYDILQMTVEQACEFFEDHHAIIYQLRVLKKVGLGYLTLGQSSTTLSGGENQRVKLSAELAKKDTVKTLYILDEPTTGLHFEDVRVLLNILQGLVDRNNTVVVIEHNMEVIKVADYVIDLGPEGGEKGGYIIAEGTPEKVSEYEHSYTGNFLKKVLLKNCINKTKV